MPLDDLVLGGGTVLAARWQHRLSTDLDLFMDQKAFARMYQRAGRFRPRLASRFDAADLGRDHFGARSGDAHITISTAWCGALLTVRERSGEAIAGIALETSEAILVRKLAGRMVGFGTFTERDLYDLAAADRHDPHALDAAFGALEPAERAYIGRELRLSKSWAQPEKALIDPSHPDIATDLRRTVLGIVARYATSGAEGKGS